MEKGNKMYNNKYVWEADFKADFIKGGVPLASINARANGVPLIEALKLSKELIKVSKSK